MYVCVWAQVHEYQDSKIPEGASSALEQELQVAELETEL